MLARRAPAARRERSPDGMDTLGGVASTHRPERTDADYIGFRVARASSDRQGRWNYYPQERMRRPVLSRCDSRNARELFAPERARLVSWEVLDQRRVGADRVIGWRQYNMIVRKL